MNGRAVVASTADTAFAVDASGRIIAWNPGAETTFGWSKKEAEGKKCWELLQGLDVFGNRYCSESCPISQMALGGQRVHRYQVHFQNSLGNKIHSEVSILAVCGSTAQDKEIVHLVRGPCLLERRLAARVKDSADMTKGHARLSARQIEVLAFLAEGRGTNDIADTLCISTSTVRHHIQEILARLKVHSRLEAVALARRTSLV